MGNSDSQIRLKCPQCQARLAISPERRSPYIRCGVCDALIEVRGDLRGSSSSRPAHQSPPVSKAQNQPKTDARLSNGATPYGRSNFAPIPSSELIHIPGERTPRRSRTGKAVFTFCMMIGVVVFVSLLLSNLRHSRRQQSRSYRARAVAQPSTTSTFTRNEKSKLEINLNSGVGIQFNQNVTSVALDGRNWTKMETQKIAGLTNLSELSYTDVEIKSRDLNVLRSPSFTSLNLSRSRWRSGYLLFNGDYYPKLKKLNLAHSNVNGFAISGLHSCKDLSDLNLRGTNISDADLAPLNKCQKLRFLDLSKTKVTAKGVASLQIPDLRILKVSAGTMTSQQRIDFTEQNSNAMILILPKLEGENDLP